MGWGRTGGGREGVKRGGNVILGNVIFAFYQSINGEPPNEFISLSSSFYLNFDILTKNIRKTVNLCLFFIGVHSD